MGGERQAVVPALAIDLPRAKEDFSLTKQRLPRSPRKAGKPRFKHLGWWQKKLLPLRKTPVFLKTEK